MVYALTIRLFEEVRNKVGLVRMVKRGDGELEFVRKLEEYPIMNKVMVSFSCLLTRTMSSKSMVS